MKIALAQMQMTNNLSENLFKAIKYIEQAKQQNADLIFFPELQLSPFFPSKSGIDPSRWLLNQNSDEIKEISQACRENQIAASINVFLKENEKNYDASLMINGFGKILGISKMVHIASFPNFYEAEYYTPSSGGFEVYDLNFVNQTYKIGIVICFDRHFPESIRSCALQGAQLIIIPTANLTIEDENMFLWEIRVQAMQNCVCVAMCNRVGEEGELTFCGKSVVINQNGDIVSYADEKEQLLTGTLNLETVQIQRAKSPYFNSRKPDKYGVIAKQE